MNELAHLLVSSNLNREILINRHSIFEWHNERWILNGIRNILLMNAVLLDQLSQCIDLTSAQREFYQIHHKGNAFNCIRMCIFGTYWLFAVTFALVPMFSDTRASSTTDYFDPIILLRSRLASIPCGKRNKMALIRSEIFLV